MSEALRTYIFSHYATRSLFQFVKNASGFSYLPYVYQLVIIWGLAPSETAYILNQLGSSFLFLGFRLIGWSMISTFCRIHEHSQFCRLSGHSLGVRLRAYFFQLSVSYTEDRNHDLSFMVRFLNCTCNFTNPISWTDTGLLLLLISSLVFINYIFPIICSFL